MDATKQIEVTLEVAQGVVVVTGRGALVEHGALAYDRRRDELLVTISPASVLRLKPGRAFAEALAGLMTKASDEGDAPEGAEVCAACGQPLFVVTVGVANKEVRLDAEPSANGVYVLTRPGKARMLRPMEHPLGATYQRHRCPGESNG